MKFAADKIPPNPRSVSVPVMFGPYYENQQETASALIDAEARGS